MTQHTTFEKLHAVRRWSGILQAITALSGLGLALLWLWLMLDPQILAELGGARGLWPDAGLTWWQVFGVRVLISLALAAPSFVLWRLFRLFAVFRSGDVLSAKAAGLILKAGYAALAATVLSVVVDAAIGVVLTATRPPGDKILAISIDSGTIALLLGGGLLVVIGWAMGAAAEAVAENREFV